MDEEKREGENIPDAGRGQPARTPSEIPAKGWRDVCWRVLIRFFNDRISLIAAGAAFYILLAMFPALTAFVLLYGFVANPSTITEHVAYLGGLLPGGGLDLIR